jgi:hypothetical protein
MENGITLSRDGKNYGPYSESQIHELIASGNACPEDHAWKEGMTEWQPLQAVMPSCVPIPPPPPAFPLQAKKQGISGMAWAAIMISAFIVIVMLASAFNDGNNAPTAADRYYTATATIRKSLKAPSTAKFSRPDDDKAYYQKVAGNVWEAGGWVDSQNAFGAMIRSDWNLVWNDATRKILYVSMGGKTLVGDYKKVIEEAKTTQK